MPHRQAQRARFKPSNQLDRPRQVGPTARRWWQHQLVDANERGEGGAVDTGGIFRRGKSLFIILIAARIYSTRAGCLKRLNSSRWRLSGPAALLGGGRLGRGSASGAAPASAQWFVIADVGVQPYKRYCLRAGRGSVIPHIKVARRERITSWRDDAGGSGGLPPNALQGLSQYSSPSFAGG